MPERVDVADAIKRILDQWKRDLRVSMPARITGYDQSTQLAEVQPQIRREMRRVDDDRERVFEDLPIIPAVPVCFPRFGPWFISFPIEPGHWCQLLVSDQDLTRWREQGRVVDPYLPSAHHISDALALPGIFPEGDELAGAHADNMVIGHDSGAQIHVTGDGKILLGSAAASDPPVLKSEYDSLKSYLDGHTHTYSDSGTATLTSSPENPTGTPDPAPSANGASKVRAE